MFRYQKEGQNGYYLTIGRYEVEEAERKQRMPYKP